MQGVDRVRVQRQHLLERAIGIVYVILNQLADRMQLFQGGQTVAQFRPELDLFGKHSKLKPITGNRAMLKIKKSWRMLPHPNGALHHYKNTEQRCHYDASAW